MLNFDRSTVKHGTQNIQNDCHQWLPSSVRVNQIRFRPGLCPDTAGKAYNTSPDPLAGLRGPTSKGTGRRTERERRGTERELEGLAPLSQIPGSAPIAYRTLTSFRAFTIIYFCSRSQVWVKSMYVMHGFMMVRSGHCRFQATKNYKRQKKICTPICLSALPLLCAGSALRGTSPPDKLVFRRLGPRFTKNSKIFPSLYQVSPEFLRSFS